MALQFILESVPDRNKFIPLVRTAVNPYAFPFLWEWFVSHLDRLEQIHPVHFERVIASLVPMAGLGREEQVRRFFEAYMSKKEAAGDTIRMAMERLEINRRMRHSAH